MVQRAATTDVQRLPEAEAQALELLPAPAYRTEHLPAAHNIGSVDGTIAALGAGPLLYCYPPDGRDDFAAGEAPFLPAPWWTVTALAVLGHPRRAGTRRSAVRDAPHAAT